jgi:OOP family OmpA-OmpF porin
MLKKVLVALLGVMVFSLPAMAIEPPAGAVIPWGNQNTAYTSAEFNNILEAYGLMLSPGSLDGVPPAYARAAGNNVGFNDTATAFRPSVYHAILTAYGLELSPEQVSAKFGLLNYASVKNGEIVFGDTSTAYNQSEWMTILSAYNMPMMASPAKMAPAKMAVEKTMPGDSDGDGVSNDMDDCPGTPKGVKVDARGCWTYDNKVLFDFDKATLKPEFYPALDEVKAVLDADPALKVTINGHTDDIGTEAYNQKLSERRAVAVRAYLVDKLGVDKNRLKAVGHGEINPAYPNDTNANRQKNRRVEFTPGM